MRSEWREVQLAEVCGFQNGFAFKSASFSDMGVPVIKIKELKDGEVKFFNDSAFINETLGKYSNYQVNNGDILFALTGDPVSKNNPLSWVGRVSRYRGDRACLLNQRVCKALPNEDEISKNYLYYYFRLFENYFALAAKATGSASQANISTKTIGDVIIPLPLLPEQRAIAATLSCLDDKIELNNKINANLEAQAQTIFKSWFVDFEPFRDGEFVDSELGPIPKGWRVVPMRQLFTFVKGKKPATLSSEKAMNTLLYLTIDTLGGNDGAYAPADKMVVANEFDTLMVMDGASSGATYYGRSGIVASTLAKLEPTNPSWQDVFHYAIKHYESFIKEHTTGSAIPHTDKEYVYQLKIALPAEVPGISTLLNVIRKEIIKNQIQSRALAALRDALLPKLMSGEIEVPVNV